MNHRFLACASIVTLAFTTTVAVAVPAVRNVAIGPVADGSFGSIALQTDPNVMLPADRSRYSGVGAVFTATDYSGFGAGCTGALISPTIVMTAAHCIYDSQTNFVRLARFRTPQNTNLPGRTAQFANGYLIHPLYTDDIGNGYDIAFLRLRSPNPLNETYGIYRGSDEFGKAFEKVGVGSLATGDRGWPNGVSDGRKRIIRNVYDTTYGNASDAAGALDARIAPFIGGTNADQVLVYDLDNGTATNDVFGRYMGLGDTGVGLYESGAAPGDSGGPTFIDGLIAGITSFGQTGSIFEVYDFDFDGDGVIGPDDWDIRCGQPGFVDFTCVRSSWGDLSGDTRVSFYADFIDSVLAGRIAFNVIPAPGALALFGLGVLALAARRRTAA